jgi:hypothetical protein
MAVSGSSENKTVRRPIVNIFKRDKDGYFIEPDVITPEIAQIIAHNQERMVKHFAYADEFIGDGNTFDEKGDTTCGGATICNQNQRSKCLLLDEDDNEIERDGSCRNYETERLGDPELPFGKHGISKAAANYAVSAKGGFSCWRCPASKQAKNVDDRGRNRWCGIGAFFQMWNGCCELNECPEINEKKSSVRKDLDDSYAKYAGDTT